ncbi:MAG: GNAT family N-acetyltransferase [Calditrichaeota bacterium]|nr:GNAT family N-acetyltransferase [Calditrichota bacterium]
MAELRIRQITPEEAATTAELIARVFPRDPSYLRLTTWYRWMLRHPDHRWDFVRVVEMDGRIVSHLLIVERQVQMRHGVLRAAGLSVVATLQEFQRRGLNRRLIEEALEYVKQAGFAISLLDGIPDYYDRYGYAVVMPKYEVRVKTASALRVEPEVEVTEVQAEEAGEWVSELKRLYDREVRSLVGPARRDETYWRWLLEKGGKLLLAKKSGKKLLAYCWIDESAAVVEEAVGEEPGAVRSLLAVLARKAKEEIAPELRLRIHPDAGFARSLLLDVGGEVVVNYPRNAGWMGRMLDLEKVLEASLPAEETKQVELCFDTDLGQVVVQVGPEGRKVQVGTCGGEAGRVKLRQDHLLQLVYGYVSAEELANRGLLEANPETVATLSKVFPRTNPVLFPRDHF